MGRTPWERSGALLASALQGCGDLRALKLSSWSGTGTVDLSALTRLSGLTSLDVSDCNHARGDLEHFGGAFPQLQALKLFVAIGKQCTVTLLDGTSTREVVRPVAPFYMREAKRYDPHHLRGLARLPQLRSLDVMINGGRPRRLSSHSGARHPPLQHGAARLDRVCVRACPLGACSMPHSFQDMHPNPPLRALNMTTQTLRAKMQMTPCQA